MTSPEYDFDAMKAALASPDPAVRRAVAIQLASLRDDRVAALLRPALDDADATTRANACAGLGLNRVIDAAPDLMACLRADADEIVRERAATALAQIGGDEALNALIDASDDPSAFVRNRVLYVLGASRDPRIFDTLLEALDHEMASTQGVAAWALGTLGDQRAFAPLRDLLRAKEASVRGNAAWALGELGDERAIAPLLRLLKDADPAVRGKTAWALGTLGEATGDVSMVSPLIGLLDDFAEVPDDSAHVFVCQYAAEALVQIGSEGAQMAVGAWRPRAQARLVPHQARRLLRQLPTADAPTRHQIAQAVAQLGTEALPVTLEALQARPVRIRQGAAQALGLLGQDEAIPALIRALADDDAGVWSQAVAALARLPADEALAIALEQHSGQAQWGIALALWRRTRADAALPWVLMALQAEDEIVQASAINSLTLQPDARALATLQIALEKADGMVARYLVQALHTLDHPGARAAITHWLAHQQPRDDVL